MFGVSFRYSFLFTQMGRKMNRWLYSIVFFLSVGCIHFLLASLRPQRFPLDRRRVLNEDYIGLDGEETYLPLSCSTCALVGTSGHLLDHKYGSKIDRNSCVFRLGFSPTRGRERHVGGRTTTRVVDSYSFFPFLKRPAKLVTGPYSSETWILYDRRAGDISWYHRPLLSSLTRKHDSIFLWLTKKAEGEVKKNLNNQTSNANIKRLSALWYALKVVQDAGCTSVDFYGIPDHKICKYNMNVKVSSLYWNTTSLPLCSRGVDASFSFDQSFSQTTSFPTVFERRALLNWKPKEIVTIRFHAPQWPS